MLSNFPIIIDIKFIWSIWWITKKLIFLCVLPVNRADTGYIVMSAYAFTEQSVSDFPGKHGRVVFLVLWNSIHHMRCCHFGFTATDHASFVVASLIEPEIIHYITIHTVHKSGSTLRSTLFGSILGRSWERESIADDYKRSPWVLCGECFYIIVALHSTPASHLLVGPDPFSQQMAKPCFFLPLIFLLMTNIVFVIINSYDIFFLRGEFDCQVKKT